MAGAGNGQGGATAVEGFANCRFYVEIGSDTQAVFTEMSGLQLETTVTEYEEGGSNGFVHRLPGRSKVGNLTLKRGMSASDKLYAWYLEILQGRFSTKNITVTMYDSTGDALARWALLAAYPVKWTGPQLTADGKNAAVQTVEFAHAGLGPT
jgi:phage tail-like protein